MYFVGENCPGCGRCIREVCPTKAIKIMSNKAIIEEQKCIDCGLCTSVCPIGIIKKQDDKKDIGEVQVNVTE